MDVVEALGNETFITGHLSEISTTTLRIRTEPNDQYSLGQSLSLSLNLEYLHFFDPDTEFSIRPMGA